MHTRFRALLAPLACLWTCSCASWFPDRPHLDASSSCPNCHGSRVTCQRPSYPRSAGQR